MKNIPCRCAYTQEILIQFFSGNYAPFELRNLATFKYTIETVCQRNSSETAQQIIVKLCSDEECAYTKEIPIQIFFGELCPFVCLMKRSLTLFL